jgi:DNA-binding LacI/PurR family transcriptional regulator
MPLASVGDEAVRALLSLLNEDGVESYLGSSLETRLVVRDSTGKIKQ